MGAMLESSAHRRSIRRLVAGLVLGSLAGAANAQSCSDWLDAPDPGEMGRAPYVVAVFDDGSGPSLYAGGYNSFAPPGVERDDMLIRWDGAHWIPVVRFTPPNPRVAAMLVHDDGSGPALYIGGDSLLGSGATLTGLVRWDGTALTPVGGRINEVESLVRYDVGLGLELFVGGYFAVAGGTPARGIARWTGTAYTNVGNLSLGGHVAELLAHDDGGGLRLYAGGYFTSVGGVPAASIASLGPNGWSSTGSGVVGSIQALAEHDFGTGPQLVAAGTFSAAGGAPAANVAAWDGGAWSPLGALPPTPGNGDLVSHDDGSGAKLYATCWTSGVFRFDGTTWTEPGGVHVPGYVTCLFEHDFGGGSKLYVGGHMGRIGSAFAANLAGWNGQSWESSEPQGAGLQAVDNPAQVQAQTMFAGELYVGGFIEGVGPEATGPAARYDGTRFHAMPGATGTTSAFATFDDGSGPALYVAGIRTIDGVGPVRDIARWDGTSWSPLSEQPGIGGLATWRIPGLTTFDDGTGPALYAVGTLPSAIPGVHGIARWRNGIWESVGGVSAQTEIENGTAVAVHDDGTGPALYFAGWRAIDDRHSVDAVMRWNGSWQQVASSPNVESVIVLLSFDDGAGPALYAGGNFDVQGGSVGNHIARWRNGVWSPLGSGTSSPVYALTVHDDGRGDGPALYAGGAFDSAGGTAVDSIARWDGSAWSSVGNGLRLYEVGSAQRPVVRSLCSGVGLPRRDLYVSGNFYYAGPHLVSSFTALPGCGETGETSCFGDGSGTACPCGNVSASADRAGCTNSFGTGGALRGRGEASIASDTLRLEGSTMSNGPALYFQGTQASNGGAGVAFGDGLRCAAGSVNRLGTLPNVGGASAYPSAGDPDISVRGAVLAPGVRYYQARYRNAATFCTPDTFNWTNMVRIVWGV